MKPSGCFPGSRTFPFICSVITVSNGKRNKKNRKTNKSRWTWDKQKRHPVENIWKGRRFGPRLCSEGKYWLKDSGLGFKSEVFIQFFIYKKMWRWRRLIIVLKDIKRVLFSLESISRRMFCCTGRPEVRGQTGVKTSSVLLLRMRQW